MLRMECTVIDFGIIHRLSYLISKSSIISFQKLNDNSQSWNDILKVEIDNALYISKLYSI